MIRVIAIGGTDSSGGAGLTRDVFAAGMVGAEVLPVVTAVTAQTDGSVLRVQAMAADVVAAQIEAALATGSVGAVKVGMLASAEIAETVAQALAGSDLPVVIDPVLRASSGGALLEGGLPGALLRRATLVTPNLPEAAMLTGLPPAASAAEIVGQAEAMRGAGVDAVLIKGGHADGPEAVDYLFDCEGRRSISAPRLAAGRRGTGCALATLIACGLAEGRTLGAACTAAKSRVHGWIAEAQAKGFTSRS